MVQYPKSRARKLRREQTAAEKKSWQVLRQFRQFGFPIRRQHPIDGMVVDFACPKAKLVIEVDGGIHNWTEVASRDEARDSALKEAGWRVIRISNETATDADTLFRTVSEFLRL